MKIRTSELEGAALDWAVATATGLTLVRVGYEDFEDEQPGQRDLPEWFNDQTDYCVGAYWADFDRAEVVGDIDSGGIIDCYSPSINWAQGGPLIDRFYVALTNAVPGRLKPAALCEGTKWMTGDTALQAAMRAIVASKIGDEVEIPDELTHDAEADA